MRKEGSLLGKRQRKPFLRWLLLLPLSVLMILAFHQLVEVPADLPPGLPVAAAQGLLSGQEAALPPDSSPCFRAMSPPICPSWLASAALAAWPSTGPAADSQGTPLNGGQHRRCFYQAFPLGDMPG